LNIKDDGMKGNNEFVYFLIGGLLILAILLSIFGLTIEKPIADNRTRSPGTIEAVKAFSIPEFSASNLIETRTTDLVSRDVYNGLLFGSDKIVYNLTKSNVQGVTVKFTVTSTNRLGNLLVMVNGKLIEKGIFELGEYEIKLNSSDISDSMLISIEAESSFWQIWAPTLYKIRDASITFTSYFDESSQFKFYLGEEYQTLQFAKVDVVFTENTGTFLVDLNGHNVWSSPAADSQAIRFDKSQLRLGDNIIRFYAAKDSKFSGRANIVIIFLTQFPETINQSGIVTAVQPFSGSY